MHSPASPLYASVHDDHFGFPTSPLQRKPNGGLANSTGNKIDYSKFKTKMCRNYLMGLPCPFEDRCAFSHGESDAERMAKISSDAYLARHDEDVEDTSSSTGSLPSPKARLTNPRMQHGSTDNFFSSNSSEGHSHSSFNHASISVTTGVTPGQNANATEFLPPPPPSYEAAVTTLAYEPLGTAATFGLSGKDAASMPPAYPTRYRHDPYSFAGIVYE